MSHTYFSINERETIALSLAKGMKPLHIAKILGRNRSSIGREIKRNSIDGEYRGLNAQEAYNSRKSSCGCGAKEKLEDEKIVDYIQMRLEDGWTPEQIAGRAKIKGVDCPCFKTIYRGIKEGKFKGTEKELLPRQGKKKSNGIKETRGTIPDKKNISERPKEADERSEIGHFESDTVVSSGKQGAMMTYVDRKSGYGLVELMDNRKAATFNQVTLEAFKVIPGKFIKTFTSDNGKEFAGFKELEKELNVECYFANPYHSWERGCNENYNGLLRRYFPKGSNFFKLTKEEVRKVMEALNHRPRKRLGWKTPHEVFWGEIQECCI